MTRRRAEFAEAVIVCTLDADGDPLPGIERAIQADFLHRGGNTGRSASRTAGNLPRPEEPQGDAGTADRSGSAIAYTHVQLEIGIRVADRLRPAAQRRGLRGERNHHACGIAAAAAVANRQRGSACSRNRAARRNRILVSRLA